MLSVGTPAPDFSLYATPDQLIRLSEFQGGKVILAFYPADWSPVCGDQMALLNETLFLFHKYDARVMGISVDGKWCHLSFSQDRNLQFPLLADFEPKGEVARRFEAYDEEKGECKRALYIVDERGLIGWRHLSPTGVNPGVDGLLNALEAMHHSKT